MLFIIFQHSPDSDLDCVFYESDVTRERAVTEIENENWSVEKVIEFPATDEDRELFKGAEDLFKTVLETDYPLHFQSPVRLLEQVILQAYLIGKTSGNEHLN